MKQIRVEGVLFGLLALVLAAGQAFARGGGRHCNPITSYDECQRRYGGNELLACNLNVAAGNGNLDEANRWLNQGADPSQTYGCHGQPMYSAVIGGGAEGAKILIIKEMVRHGGSLRGYPGKRTLLEVAANDGPADVVAFLLGEREARDTLHEVIGGQTPLLAAIEWCRAENVKLILQVDTDLSVSRSALPQSYKNSLAAYARDRMDSYQEYTPADRQYTEADIVGIAGGASIYSSDRSRGTFSLRQTCKDTVAALERVEAVREAVSAASSRLDNLPKDRLPEKK